MHNSQSSDSERYCILLNVAHLLPTICLATVIVNEMDEVQTLERQVIHASYLVCNTYIPNQAFLEAIPHKSTGTYL